MHNIQSMVRMQPASTDSLGTACTGQQTKRELPAGQPANHFHFTTFTTKCTPPFLPPRPRPWHTSIWCGNRAMAVLMWRSGGDLNALL